MAKIGSSIWNTSLNAAAYKASPSTLTNFKALFCRVNNDQGFGKMYSVTHNTQRDSKIQNC